MTISSNHSRAALVLFALTLASGSLPAAIAWVGKNIVDQAVVHAFAPPPVMVEPVLWWVALELVLVVLSQAVDRGAWLNDSLLRTSLGHAPRSTACERTTSTSSNATHHRTGSTITGGGANACTTA